jgi:hypothetical protein
MRELAHGHRQSGLDPSDTNKMFVSRQIIYLLSARHCDFDVSEAGEVDSVLGSHERNFGHGTVVIYIVP